jgi:hypothetical protein
MEYTGEFQYVEARGTYSNHRASSDTGVHVEPVYRVIKRACSFEPASQQCVPECRAAHFL